MATGRGKAAIKRGTAPNTYVDTARERGVVGEYKVKLELVSPRVELPAATKRQLVVEERRIPPGGRGHARGGGLVGDARGALEDAHEAMQGDGEVGDADGLGDDQDHGAVDMVAGGVGAVGLVGADVEVVEVAADGSQGQEAVEERATGGRPVFLRRAREAHPRSIEAGGTADAGDWSGGRATVLRKGTRRRRTAVRRGRQGRRGGGEAGGEGRRPGRRDVGVEAWWNGVVG